MQILLLTDTLHSYVFQDKAHLYHPYFDIYVNYLYLKEQKIFHYKQKRLIIPYYLLELPELQQVVGEDATNTFIEDPSEGNLKACFSAMMNAPKEKIESALNDLLARFSEMGLSFYFQSHQIILSSNTI